MPKKVPDTFLFARKAFTLIEVMIVLTIMIIFVALAMPFTEKALASHRLKKAADAVRAEWAQLRTQAMEDGQILCCRAEINGSRMLIDRVMDAHFSAALSTDSEEESLQNEFSPNSGSQDGTYFGGVFTGSDEDFILRDPSLATEDSGARFVTLPDGVTFSDGLAVPDERTAYVLGSVLEDTESGSVSLEQQQIMDRDGRYGETTGRDGQTWAAPIFFFPDGTTSTAAVLLKNEHERCLEVRLRGLTGGTKVGEMQSPNSYQGQLLFRD